MKSDIGVGVNPPEKECQDPRCPWHGKTSVRGRVFQGSVRSAKSHSTVIVEWGYHRFVPKYERYERRKSRVPAHNPPCIHAREGDLVIAAECRHISKTKCFVIVGLAGKAKLEIRGEEQKIAMKEKKPGKQVLEEAEPAKEEPKAKPIKVEKPAKAEKPVKEEPKAKPSAKKEESK